MHSFPLQLTLGTEEEGKDQHAAASLSPLIERGFDLSAAVFPGRLFWSTPGDFLPVHGLHSYTERREESNLLKRNSSSKNKKFTQC